MVKMQVNYRGNLRCELTHEPSQAIITTDAPKDNQGQGAAFSPTDLVGAALGSCILTTMAIAARNRGINFADARVEVTKEMVSQPARRIGALRVHLSMPQSLSEADRAYLEKVAHHCPVHRSLHPDVNVTIAISYH